MDTAEEAAVRRRRKKEGRKGRRGLSARTLTELDLSRLDRWTDKATWPSPSPPPMGLDEPRHINMMSTTPAPI